MLLDFLGLGVLLAGYSGIAVLGARTLWRSRGNEIIDPESPWPPHVLVNPDRGDGRSPDPSRR